jgi:adenylate cyclase
MMMKGAYVPRLLGELALELHGDEPFRCFPLNGIVVFVDIVDSTATVEQFAVAGLEGAERLGGILNEYFATVFGIVQANEGDVIRLHGDAVLALWRATDSRDLAEAAARASSAAAALCERNAEWSSSQPGVILRHRVVVSGGPMLAMVLRSHDEQSFFMLTGAPIDALSTATHGAVSEPVVTADVLRLQSTAADGLSPSANGEPLCARAMCGAAPSSPPIIVSERHAGVVRKFVPRMVADRMAKADLRWLAEFRVVTMVYVRLEGLESAPPDRIDAAVGVIQDTIRPFGIALFDLLIGDKGLIAQIACGVPPSAQERNAVRALEAARQIQPRLRAIGIGSSIGVASGRAFCGDVGNDSRRECLITGTAMHTGARLMQAAGGGILCDSATAQAASDHFHFTEPVLLALKGIREAVSVYRADGLELKSRGISDAANTVHGRGAEIRGIAAALEDLERDRGATLLIEAEPGAGKSRLLAHIRAEASARGMIVAGTATSSIELTTAYFACRSLVRQLLLVPSDPPDADVALLRQRLLEAVSADALRQKAALIEDILPLGIEQKGLATEITGPARLAGLEDLFVLLASRRASAAPLVVLVDDVHWLDDPSARLLLALVRRVPRVLLTLATRALDDKAAPNVRKLVEMTAIALPLARLDRNAMVSMLRELLGVRSVPPDFADFVYEQAEGLPFHTEQLALSLLDRGVVRVAEGRCRVDMSELSSRTVPDNLRDLIVSRIDALGPVHQVTAKIASAIGRTFRLEILRHIFPFAFELSGLNDVLRDLARVGILESAAPADHSTCGFRHVLIKEATYELLTFEQRQPLHKRIAEFIEERYQSDLEPHYAELADHFERAGEFSRAIEYRQQAAQLAMRRYANHDALKHLDRIEALSSCAQLPMSRSQAAQFAEIRADALHELTRFTDAQEHFKRCAALSGIAVPVTRAELMTSALVEVGRQVLHRCGLIRTPTARDARHKERLTAHIYTRFAEHAYFTGDALWLVHGTMTSLNHAERVGAVAEIIEGYGGLAIGLGTAGLHRLARFYRDRSIERAEREGTLHDQGFAHLLACVYSFQAGDWAATEMHCGKGAAICQRIGDRFRYQSCRVIEGYMHVLRGHYDVAEETLKGLGEDADEVENIPVRAWVLAGRAIIDAIRGRSPLLALARLSSARDDSLHDAERLLCDGLEALAQLAAGDLDQAARTADLAFGNMDKHPPTMGCAYLSIAAVVEIHLVMAERATTAGAATDALLARARAACRASRAYASKTPIYVPRSFLLSGRLAMLHGRPQRARALWRRALAEAKERGMPLEEALANIALAQVADDPEEQRQCHTAGRELLDRLRADPWVYAAAPPREVDIVTA